MKNLYTILGEIINKITLPNIYTEKYTETFYDLTKKFFSKKIKELKIVIDNICNFKTEDNFLKNFNNVLKSYLLIFECKQDEYYLINIVKNLIESYLEKIKQKMNIDLNPTPIIGLKFKEIIDSNKIDKKDIVYNNFFSKNDIYKNLFIKDNKYKDIYIKLFYL